MPQGKIIIISGPSGSGKTTLYRKLLKSPHLKGKLIKSISLTTRRPRSKEVHGRDYIFVSKKMFLYKKRLGHFLESQKVFDNYYGTPKAKVRELLKAGQNVLLCIDVKGAKAVLTIYPRAVRLFITVPSLRILKHRLAKRGTEIPQTLNLRLKIAQAEIKESKHYNYRIVNKDLSYAYQKLESILLKELL